MGGTFSSSYTSSSAYPSRSNLSPSATGVAGQTSGWSSLSKPGTASKTNSSVSTVFKARSGSMNTSFLKSTSSANPPLIFDEADFDRRQKMAEGESYPFREEEIGRREAGQETIKVNKTRRQATEIEREEWRKQSEEVNKAKEEAIRIAQEVRTMVEEAKLKEKEAERKEEEMKKKEEKVQRQAEEAKKKEEQVKRREVAAKEEARRVREEARKREQDIKYREEELEQKEEELRRRERVIEAEKLQKEEKEAERKESERLQKQFYEEGQKRLEEQRKREERFRHEQQQEEFRRREKEIHGGKRQDSTRGTFPSFYASSSIYPSRPSPSPSATGVAGQTSAWSSSFKAGTASKANSSASAASKSRSGSMNTTFPTSTPSPNPPSTFDETEFKRRQEEFSQQQQEKFRREQLRFEETRQRAESSKLSSEEVLSILERHDRQWNILISSTTGLHWGSIPWPMFFPPQSPEDITFSAVTTYLQSPLLPDREKAKLQKDRLKEMFKRWHLDRFETKYLPRIIETDREKVKEGTEVVMRLLNKLLTKVNTHNPFGSS
ncbi:hypothetical protein C0992_003020 [Termitomyces sp. T32_za158]|nr:hypothetical protein C0992_003020 [Termitomyces sp. T32_za158]